MPKRKPLEGTVIGFWEVISYKGCKDGKKSIYVCRCKLCGEIYEVRGDQLRSGKTHQCKHCR